MDRNVIVIVDVAMDVHVVIVAVNVAVDVAVGEGQRIRWVLLRL